MKLVEQHTKRQQLHSDSGCGETRRNHKNTIVLYKCFVSGTIQKVDYPCEDDFDFYVLFEYKGYKFKFKSGKPCVAIMTEPDGTNWECTYDYGYGAGWE